MDSHGDSRSPSRDVPASAPSGDIEQPRPGQRPRLHISSLPASWGNSEASTHFSPFGTIVDLIVFREPGTGRSRYGFIEFAEMSQAQAALAATHNQRVEDATLNIKFAAPKAGGGTYGPNAGASGPVESNFARLYVGNIGTGTTTEQVRAEFEVWGKLREVSVWQNHKASMRRGGEESLSAFVEYEVSADAKAAKEALHSKSVLRGDEPALAEKQPDFQPTPPLIVDFAKPKALRASFGGGGGGRGGQGGYGGGYGGQQSNGGGYGGGYGGANRGYDDRRNDDRGYGGAASRGYDDRRGGDSYDDRRRYDDRSAGSSSGRGYYDDRSSSSRYPPTSSSSYGSSSYGGSSSSGGYGASASSSYRDSSSYDRSASRRSRSPRRERSRERSPRREATSTRR